MTRKPRKERRGPIGAPGKRTLKSRAEGGLRRRVAQLERRNARLIAACDRAFMQGRDQRGKARRWRELADLERGEKRRLLGVARRAISENDSARRRMSRELNGRIVQTLVGINLRLATLKLLLGADRRKLARGIDRTQRLLEKSAAAVTRYSRRLHPGLLDEVGLIPALEACIREISARTGLSIRLSKAAEPAGLTGEKRFALYHVAEAALEAAQRRRAKRAFVRIGIRSERVTLTIVDDVGPIEFGSTGAREGGRLAAARQALEIAGGSLSVEPSACPGAAFPTGRPLASAASVA